MDEDQRKLSAYIDRLNAEQKPEENEYSTTSPQLKQLYQTVRLVRSLREPEMPDSHYEQQLIQSATNQWKQRKTNKVRKIWVASASCAAIFMLVVLIHGLLPLGQGSIVQAMGEAFQEVEAYYGQLEIIETNALGDSTIQAIWEVWANSEGHYYLKGLEGSQKDVITVNNGEVKWQIRPDLKEVHLFPAFPDPYRFSFELGNEIVDVHQARSTKIVGEERIAGRASTIVEVVPQGGEPYQLWVDQKTNLPLKKEYAQQNGLHYTLIYTKMDVRAAIPVELTTYSPPVQYKEIRTDSEQLVHHVQEAEELVGFTPRPPQQIPSGYNQERIVVIPNRHRVTFYYIGEEPKKQILLHQEKVTTPFHPVPTAILATINQSPAEIRSPLDDDRSLLSGAGMATGQTDLHSIRWQQSGFQYTLIGNSSLEELMGFAEYTAQGSLQIPSPDHQDSSPAQVKVPVDLEVEENTQKSVDAGHSPWRLDPVYVAQVFVSLQLSPEGIMGEYPISYESLTIIKNTGKEAVVEVNQQQTPTKKVYLQRLIREDSSGIWTVVGYDPVDEP